MQTDLPVFIIATERRRPTSGLASGTQIVFLSLALAAGLAVALSRQHPSSLAVHNSKRTLNDHSNAGQHYNNNSDYNFATTRSTDQQVVVPLNGGASELVVPTGGAGEPNEQEYSKSAYFGAIDGVDSRREVAKGRVKRRGGSDGSNTSTSSGTNKSSPSFGAPIGNVSAVLGRDVRLVCTVDNLGHHQVSRFECLLRHSRDVQ